MRAAGASGKLNITFESTWLLCSFLLCYLVPMRLSCQSPLKVQPDDVLQCYGVVFAEDGVTGLFGAHIYSKDKQFGTSTDRLGFFSMAVPAGEMLLVSHRGYVNQRIQIPPNEVGSYSTLITMREDATMLDEVAVSFYMNEAQFKRAVLSFDYTSYHFLLPQESRHNLFPQSMDAYIYSLEQQQMQQYGSYKPAYVSFTDIFLQPIIQHIRKKSKNNAK